VIISYRRSGTYRSHLQGSLRNYRFSRCNDPEERIYLDLVSFNFEISVVMYVKSVAYPGYFREVSTNSAEDRGQIERGSGGGSPLVSDSTQFANG
jgi:hypothetical protein